MSDTKSKDFTSILIQNSFRMRGFVKKLGISEKSGEEKKTDFNICFLGVSRRKQLPSVRITEPVRSGEGNHSRT